MLERTALKMVARFRRMGVLLGGVALFLLLASCTPGGAVSNTSPGTSSSGPVVIGTDHSIYATAERIQVTVTNHLQVAIYTSDEDASCSILDLEMQVNGQWQTSNSQAECSEEHQVFLVRIASGQSYTAMIGAGDPPLDHQATFIPGRYRLALSYSTVAPKSTAELAQSSTTIYSATLTIQGSGPPPSPPPSSGGTPVRQTLPTIVPTQVLPPSPTTR